MACIVTIALVCSVFIGILKLIKTRDILNPVTLTTLSFSIPTLICLLRLSNLQSKSWDDITYLIILYAICAFIFIPHIFTYNKKIILNRYNVYYNISASFLLFLFIVSIIFYFYGNLFISGDYLPVLSGENLSEVHTESISFFSTLTLLLMLISNVLLYFKYKNTQNKFYFILCLILCALPLTRLARMDTFISLVILVFISYDLSNNRKKYLLTILTLTPMILIMIAAIGEYRMTVGYSFNIKYANEIDFSVYSGPFDVFAMLYGYFPLSVENLDRFVKANINFSDYQFGVYTFRPILVGIFKMHRFIDDYPMYEYFNNLRDPLTLAATVPTALAEFTIDYGYYFSIFPMLVFSFIGVILYNKSAVVAKYRLCYLIYATNYVLFSFTNAFIQPIWLYCAIIIILYHSLKGIFSSQGLLAKKYG